jgi:hypothetical protein
MRGCRRARTAFTLQKAARGEDARQRRPQSVQTFGDRNASVEQKARISLAIAVRSLTRRKRTRCKA